MNKSIVSLAMRTCVLAILTLAVISPMAAQQATRALQVTLADAVAMALAQGYQARAAEATRDAARYRSNAFYSRMLPQLTLSGQVPTYNRSIIPVTQPDGSTLFRPQDQTNVALGATVTQAIPMTGTEVFVSSSLELSCQMYHCSTSRSLKRSSNTTIAIVATTPLRTAIFFPMPAIVGEENRGTRKER